MFELAFLWGAEGMEVGLDIYKGSIKVVQNVCYLPCINRVSTVFSPTDAADMPLQSMC